MKIPHNIGVVSNGATNDNTNLMYELINPREILSAMIDVAIYFNNEMEGSPVIIVGIVLMCIAAYLFTKL